ncbi:MAG: glycosyltransferase family 39 protein [Candidatus Omnitrophota bacterium]
MSKLRRGFWILFWAGLAARLLYVTAGFIELSPDEAYYWQWSRRLDWSYYSKGPLVAFLIRLGTLIGGDTAFGVRLPTVILSALTLYFSLRLYDRLFPKDDLGVFFMAVFYNTIPLMLVGSMIATIDPPLCAAWMGGTLALHKAVRGERWGWAGLALALGFGIAAKYTMLLFLPTIFFYLLSSFENCLWMKRLKPYLAIACGMTFLLTALIWNEQHQWVTYRHTMALGHIGAATQWPKNLINFLEMMGTQAGVISPILFVLLIMGVWIHGSKLLHFFRDETYDGSALILSSCAPVFLFYFLLSFERPINANWLAVVYPPAILAGAQVCAEKWREGWGRKLLPAGAALGAILCFGLLFSDVFHFLNLPQSQKWDPAARLKGWKDFAALAKKAADGLPQDVPYFYFGDRYQTSSELSFYLEDHPWTLCASSVPLSNQYDVWGGSRQKIGWNGVFAMRDKRAESLILPWQVDKAFARVESAGEATVVRYGKIIRCDRVWRCFDFKGWPMQVELNP